MRNYPILTSDKQSKLNGLIAVSGSSQVKDLDSDLPNAGDLIDEVTRLSGETSQSNVVIKSHDANEGQSDARHKIQFKDPKLTTTEANVKYILTEFRLRLGDLCFTTELKSLGTNDLVCVNQILTDIQSSVVDMQHKIMDMQHKIVTELRDRCSNTPPV